MPLVYVYGGSIMLERSSVTRGIGSKARVLAGVCRPAGWLPVSRLACCPCPGWRAGWPALVCLAPLPVLACM